MQPSDGKISLIGNLFISNKTRNPKVKGINEFVNNVVYNWGNYGNIYGHTESGDAYIMGGDSAGISNVNIINNYFISGPHTSNNVTTPFNRGNANFYLFGSGNYFDSNKNGVLDGQLVPENLSGYPTGDLNSFRTTPYDYPVKNPTLTAQNAFDQIVLTVGASFPKRDQVDSLMISDLNSLGEKSFYVYRETDLPFQNNGVGYVRGGVAPLDSDFDGMPDDWEDTNYLDKNNAADALLQSNNQPPYLNIEVYINSLVNENSNLSVNKFDDGLAPYIYPNPTTSTVSINRSFTFVKVYDLMGKERIKSTSKTIDFSELPKSIYLVTLYDNTNKILGISKVIKK